MNTEIFKQNFIAGCVKYIHNFAVNYLINNPHSSAEMIKEKIVEQLSKDQQEAESEEQQAKNEYTVNEILQYAGYFDPYETLLLEGKNQFERDYTYKQVLLDSVKICMSAIDTGIIEANFNIYLNLAQQEISKMAVLITEN